MIDIGLLVYSVGVALIAVHMTKHTLDNRRPYSLLGLVSFALAWPPVIAYALVSVTVDEIAAARRRAKDRARGS